MNIYDQIIGRGYTYLGAYIKKRRIIEDISWDRIIIKKQYLLTTLTYIVQNGILSAKI